MSHRAYLYAVMSVMSLNAYGYVRVLSMALVTFDEGSWGRLSIQSIVILRFFSVIVLSCVEQHKVISTTGYVYYTIEHVLYSLLSPINPITHLLVVYECLHWLRTNIIIVGNERKYGWAETLSRVHDPEKSIQ